MKKATITRRDLESHLERIAEELTVIASFDMSHEAVRELGGGDRFAREFFSVGPGEHMPSRGRGRRVCFPVGWIWWPGRFDADRGAALVASKILAVPGVEEITEPELDPQFRLIWHAKMVVRESQ